MSDAPRRPATAAWLALALAAVAVAATAHAAPEPAGPALAAAVVSAAGRSAIDPGAADTDADSAATDTADAGETAARTPEEAALVAETGDEESVEAVPLWMEAYGEGIYSEHEEDNTAGFADIKIGKRFDLGRPLDVYAKARMFRDARDFYWNNHLDAGAGVRLGVLKGAALSVYAEVLTGFYYRTSATVGDLGGLQARLDRNRSALDAVQARFQGVQVDVFRRAALGDTVFTQQALDSLDARLSAQGMTLSGLDAYLDSLETTRDSLLQTADSLALIPAGPLMEYRAGFVFWYGRGQEADGGPGGAFPLRFWCDLYGEGLFGTLRRTVRTRGGGETYRDSTARFTNLILYANPDVGVVLLDGPAGSLAAYATLYAWFDTHRDWWNNRAMAGPGVRHKPFRNLDFVLTFEYLWGAYYGRERNEDPNPYDRAFQDVRLQASFWYGVGF